MKICVIVPMYNEENIAKLSVTTIISYIKQIPDTFTLVVVNDGSKDKTEIILKGLLSEYARDQYELITYPDNRGYGAALKAGISFAIDNNYDYIVFMDSDLTNHPKYLKDFYRILEEEDPSFKFLGVDKTLFKIESNSKISYVYVNYWKDFIYSVTLRGDDTEMFYKVIDLQTAKISKIVTVN